MLSVIVLAGGLGTRMVSDTPKVLHPIAGKAIIHHVLDVALSLKPQQVIAVLHPDLDAEQIKGGRPVTITRQMNPLGTGDAVRVGLEALKQKDNLVLILCGDIPLINADELECFIDQHKTFPQNSISFLGIRLNNPRQYGRLVKKDSKIEKIVEFKDATSEERQINLCNSGIILTSQQSWEQLLPLLTCQNAAREYYVTDICALGKTEGIDSYVVEAKNPENFHGINNRVELAWAENQYQQQMRQKVMLAGVTLIDPETVYFSYDTVIGKDTVIYPHVFFGPGVTIGENVIIYSSCHLTKTILGSQTKVGPFAHLREYTILEEKAEIGNFVEVKKSTLKQAAKAKHLTYLGDSIIGEKANVGAGVITCNYDGFNKHQTTIGAGAFIGSNSALVAPVIIGENAMVGAGSIVTTDVPDEALAVAREKQKNILNWAFNFRAKNKTRI